MTTVPVVGVDLVEVSRVERIVKRHPERFVQRYFTAAERSTCGTSTTRLAARWAAKEACAKALGTGLGAVKAREIEVVNDRSGAPTLRLHGSAQRVAKLGGFRDWSLSLSHTADHAIAVVVALRAQD